MTRRGRGGTAPAGKTEEPVFPDDFLFNVYLQTLREYPDFERHLRTYYSYLEGAEVEGNG